MGRLHSAATLAALAAAALFGASTSFAKQLVGNISPLLLAGLACLVAVWTIPFKATPIPADSNVELSEGGVSTILPV